MKKLSKKSLVYLYIIYAIWLVADYYSQLFKIDTTKDCTAVPVQIREKEGKTFIRFEFPMAEPYTGTHTGMEIAEIFQEFLVLKILPEIPSLRPYQGGTSYYDLAPALYVDLVAIAPTYCLVDVLLVDNPQAYQYYIQKRNLEVKI